MAKNIKEEKPKKRILVAYHTCRGTYNDNFKSYVNTQKICNAGLAQLVRICFTKNRVGTLY